MTNLYFQFQEWCFKIKQNISWLYHNLSIISFPTHLKTIKWWCFKNQGW